MTKWADDKARDNFKNRMFHDEFNYTNEKVSSMTIKLIKAKEAREYIATFHYSQSLPDSTKFIYAGYYNDKLAGIICYGMGAGKSQYKAILSDIQQGEYLELTRLWSHDNMPKNTESKLISMSLKALPSQYRLVISFADPSQGHLGIIYQATNFYYCGMTSGGKCLITEDGKTQHTRLLGIYKARHPELRELTTKQLMDKYKWTYGVNHGKHRYVMLLGNKTEKKKSFKLMKDKILPYPKKEK